MWLRRAFFGWLIPSAFVLPLWLLIGWGVFQAGGWAFLWVLFIAVPSVLLGQLLLTLLVRSRPTVRTARVVSWWDVLGFTVWHGLTIAVGFFLRDAFGWLLAGAIVAFLALFWLSLWQLWNESGRSRGLGIRIGRPVRGDPADRASRERVRPSASGSDVFVIRETDRDG
ncbi:MFS transporter permease [Microbacterium pseudoresistens]|uniref:MFS transporter permease n=1 Tax=Microbacterium pseudoresistens TaxID=640634 RepID=A0A7Y9EWI4_9MICO|nr:MFS transporter permease [Microbacterium pseudoresistens]NYD55259.1 hypothetical protein [Microbacterium pseudoresistens]